MRIKLTAYKKESKVPADHRPLGGRSGQDGGREGKGTAGILMSGDDLPRHVAIVMDGNGRWAERRKRTGGMLFLAHVADGKCTLSWRRVWPFL